MASWQDVEYVFVTIPVCPNCGSTRAIRVRTDAAGDGSFSRRMICELCSRRFIVVFERPDTGNSPAPLA